MEQIPSICAFVTSNSMARYNVVENKSLRSIKNLESQKHNREPGNTHKKMLQCSNSRSQILLAIFAFTPISKSQNNTNCSSFIYGWKWSEMNFPDCLHLNGPFSIRLPDSGSTSMVSPADVTQGA